VSVICAITALSKGLIGLI